MEILNSVLVTGAIMAALGGILAFFLAIADKRLYVFEDPRIGLVEELLPHSNCGGCGTAGCRNFAEQVVEGKIEPAACTVNTPDQNKSIAALLGVAMGNVEKRVARLACAGGKHVATGFVPLYEAILVSGGSQSPADTVRPAGIDLFASDFWQKGYDVLKELIEELKGLVGQ